jgi:hypothetical protein
MYLFSLQIKGDSQKKKKLLHAQQDALTQYKDTVTSLTIVISSPLYTQFWHGISLFRSNISDGQCELLCVSLRNDDVFRGANRRQRMGRIWESWSSKGTAFWSQSGLNAPCCRSHSGIWHLHWDTVAVCLLSLLALVAAELACYKQRIGLNWAEQHWIISAVLLN